MTQQPMTEQELLEIMEHIAARQQSGRHDPATEQAVAESFGAWWDCIQSLPEGPDKEEELRLLHRFCVRFRDDPFVALIDRVHAMPEGPEKEAQQALLDKLDGSKFEKAWKNHVFGMLEEMERHRRPGAGRKPYFAPDRISALQQICREVLRENPKLVTKTNDDLAEHLRPKLKLNRDERKASTRTLLRHIIKPVLDELQNK